MTTQRLSFSPNLFLSTVGPGRTMISFGKGQAIYTQGSGADALFVIKKGLVRLSVKSHAGKVATLDILSDEDLVGEESITSQHFRTASARTITDCHLLRIEKRTMMLTLRSQGKLANALLEYMVASSIRYQQHLVDQRCNPGEKRLARILSLLAHFDRHELTEVDIPKISQETLAEMVGTTRSRASFFMQRFKQSGLIDYNAKSSLMRVSRKLLAFYSQ
jgi:CRP/FNR family cyclic AMP-dependent transcriptional regulator